MFFKQILFYLHDLHLPLGVDGQEIIEIELDHRLGLFDSVLEQLIEFVLIIQLDQDTIQFGASSQAHDACL